MATSEGLGSQTTRSLPFHYSLGPSLLSLVLLLMDLHSDFLLGHD